MKKHQDFSYLTRLGHALDAQRYRLSRLMLRLRGLGVPGAMKPSVFKKFLCLLEQVSIAKDKETGLISRIEAMEAAHCFQRQCNGLKNMAETSEPKKDNFYSLDDELSGARPDAWAWVLAFFWLFSQRGINQKKQGLTVD